MSDQGASDGATPLPYLKAGYVVGDKYRIEAVLGEGGMGAVAKATHRVHRGHVALKFMNAKGLAYPNAAERFINEARVAMTIANDHVVKIFDVGELADGTLYLVMEFLNGCDLSRLLKNEGGRLEPPRAVHFALQILWALKATHGRAVVHRDIKPSNCFVTPTDEDPDFLKLVDFGISKVARNPEDAGGLQLTGTHQTLGSPTYMAPEQIMGTRSVEAPADLYSVGAVLYELLAGCTPHVPESENPQAFFVKRLTTEPVPIRDFRSDLRRDSRAPSTGHSG